MPPPTLTLPGLDSEVSNSCPQNRSLSDKTDTGNTGEKEATKELKSKTASLSHQRQASFISEDKPKIFGATGSDVNEACSENTVLYKFRNGSCENLSKVIGEENILKSNIWPLECCEEHCDLAWSSQAESVAYRQGQSNCPPNCNTPNSNSPEYNTLEARNGLYYEEVIKGESDILPSYSLPLSKTDSNDKRKLFDCAIATSNEINYSQGYRFAYPSTDNGISSFTEADSGAIAKPDYSDVSQPILQTSCEYYPLSKVNNNHNSAGIKSEEEFLLPSSMACASTLTEGRMHNTPLVVSKPHYITSTDNVHLATRRKVCDHFPDSVSVPFPRFASRVQPSLQDKTQNLPNNLRESQSFKLYIQTFTQCELECPTTGAFKFMNAPSSHTTSSLPDFYTQDPEQNNYYDPHGSNNSFSRVAHQNQAYFDENDHANHFRCNARACDNKFCLTGNMEEKTTAESSINQNESKLEGIDLYEESNSNTIIGDNFGQSSSQSNVINPSQCFSAHSPVINPYHTEHRPYFVREQSQTSIFIDCPYKSGGLDVNSRGSLNNEHDWNFSSKSCTSDVRHADEMNLHPMQFTNSSIDQKSTNIIRNGEMNKFQTGNYLDVWRQKKQQICFEKEQCESYSATRKDNSDEIMAKNSTASGVQVTSSNMSLYYDLHATHPVIGGHNHSLSTVQRVADPNPHNLPTSAPLFDGMACSVAATLPENTEKPTRKKQRYVKMHGKTVDSKRFSCPTSACTKRFSTEKELQIHINKHHIGMAKPYFCGYCSKSFKRPDQLKRHEKIHTGEKPHKCTICGRPFARTDHRNTHYKKHNSLEKNNAKFLQDTSANNIPQSYTNGDTASSQYDAFQRWV